MISSRTLSCVPFHLLLTFLLTSVFGFAPLWAQDDEDSILQFTFISDTHQFGSTADVREADANVNAFVQYCNNHPSVQFALFGGDFYNSYDTNHDQGLSCLRQSATAFSGLQVPFYSTRGNHDCNGKCRLPNRLPDNTQIVTDREFYDIFSPTSQNSHFYHPEGICLDPVNPTGNYYYRDFGRQRIRLIVLNYYDRDSLELPGYHGQQMRWLSETALDFSDKGPEAHDWSFLILGHAVTIDYLHNPVTRLLHAYVRGQDFFDSDAGVSYGRRYSMLPRAQFIAFLHGHYHEDSYKNWDGYNIISVNRGYATGSETGIRDESFDHFIINTRNRTIEERRIGRGPTRIYSYQNASQLYPGNSFPEANGMGRYTIGGRLGQIVHVTSLADRGPGTLREAVSLPFARYIVFDVSGTIALQSPLVISHDSITIAGHSAQGSGIRLMGAPMVVNASEVVIRYLEVSQLRDADFGHTQLVIDHVTAHSDTATALSIRRTKNVSVQFCHISSGSSYQPALLAGGVLATYLYNHIEQSPLALKFSDFEGENRWIQIGRNLISGWQHRAMYGGGHQGEFSIHENIFIPDSSTLHPQLLDVADDGTARYYFRNNLLEGPSTQSINDRPGVSYEPLPADTLNRRYMDVIARPHDVQPAKSCLTVAPFPSINTLREISKPDLLHKVKREAGCRYRPGQVHPDSLISSASRTDADIIAYLDRQVSPERSIVILYDNDVHCRIDGYPYLVGMCEPMASDTATVALVSSGDFLQGGVAGSITQGQAIAGVLRHVPYDAIALGTHDFDFARRDIDQLIGVLDLPIVCANLRRIETDSLILPPFIIRQYGRRRVAYIGVTTPTAQITNALVLSDSLGHLLCDFDPEHLYQRVQHTIDSVRTLGADIVIVLSQLGFDPDRFGISAPALIGSTTGIDAVIDGHTHSAIPQLWIPDRNAHQVLYTQSGENFAYIGKLVIDPDGNLCSELLLRQQMKFRDTHVSQVVDSIKGCYMDAVEQIAGRSLVHLVKPKEFVQGDSLVINAGNLVTDAMLWAADADIAWINVGSIRHSLPMGEITRGDILEMLPYGNELITLQIPGTLLYDFSKRLVGNLPIRGGVVSPVSGLKVVLRQKRGKHFTLSDIQVYDRGKSRYVPIDPHKTYTIVTTTYCTSIGWSVKILFDQYQQQHLGISYSQATFQYISQQLNGLVELTPQLSGQRVILKGKKG